MRSRGPLALGLTLIAAPAFANTDLVVTGGGGVVSELATRACLEQGQGKCPANQHPGTMLLGAGISRVSDVGVRGSLRLEGVFSFGDTKGRQGQILGAAGWQGDWLVIEGGLGWALLWSADQSGARLGGLLHGGLGLRVLPALTLLVRTDAAISEGHQPFFLGATVEWLPLVAARARR
jgi:hypothetical protein